MTEIAVNRPGPASSVIDRPTGRRRGDRVVGVAPATRRLVEQAQSCARSALPVVITGPAGSGKEHLARAIHAWSDHADGPFVVVSCAAVPEDLLGREIFGCGARVHPQLLEAHVGALSRAAGGTLLLDGAEHLSDSLRGRLARAATERRFRPDGASADESLDARLVAKSLEPPAASPFGTLSVHRLRLEALSERPEDVLPLAAHFLRLHADELGVKPVGFTPEARDALVGEPWAGNVRELGERIRQALLLAGSGALTAESLLLSADGEAVPSFKEAKRAFETRYVVGLLRRCGGNISHAARLAKKDRKDFYDVIRRTGVDPAEFR